MSRADADVYYQRGAEAETGLVARWCRRAGRKFVFGAASDTNFLPDLPLVPGAVDRTLFRYGLRRADAIVVQTQRQRRMLRDTYDLSAEVVNNACAVPAADEVTRRVPNGVLWIGRFHECKRADWIPRLAREFPDVRFTVIGASNAATSYERRVGDELARLPNVVRHAYVPYARMAEHYRAAQALLCTSSDEGFPNTFLEAWACGVPVLTTFDPDGIVAAHGLGRTVADFDGIRDGLTSLLDQPRPWESCGARARLYVVEHHRVEAVADALGRVLERVCERGAPVGRFAHSSERG
jgi:glycosyltransferase involved in cell wall biosynthesis